jgi:hypothetical protein
LTSWRAKTAIADAARANCSLFVGYIQRTANNIEAKRARWVPQSAGRKFKRNKSTIETARDNNLSCGNIIDLVIIIWF